jgi:maltose/moltooligosaccharide transporter
VPQHGEKVAPTVIWSFYVGGAILLLSVIWTSVFTKEYPPTEYANYHNLDSETTKSSFKSLISEIPPVMWALAVVQFFSWFALFLMWVYTTSGIAQNVWHTLPADSTSAAFNTAGNWVGVIFACYSLFAAIFSMFMAKLANSYGRKAVYMWSLVAGGVGLISMIFIHHQDMLILPMVGVGIAWAAILAMPYAILSAKLPADKMGVYMGVFNASITIPQITAGILGGILFSLVHDKAVLMLGIAGLSMIIGGLSVFLICDDKEADIIDHSIVVALETPNK